MNVQHLGAFDAFNPEKLAKHNLFETERFFLDVYCLQPGQQQKVHSHATSDKVYVVLEGVCRFQVGEESAVHGVGSAVFAPAGSPHGVENSGPHNARLLVMMTPPPPPAR